MKRFHQIFDTFKPCPFSSAQLNSHTEITHFKHLLLNFLCHRDIKDASVKIDNTPLTAVSQLTDNTYIYEIAVSPTENTEISETGETTSSQQSIRLSEDKIYKADIQYYAVTGDGFTEYSNYQAVLQAELLDQNGVTIGNKPTDYLVYTNAKVYPTVIEESNT